MLRIGLTLWFVLTTLAGPGLCCCSLRAAVGTHPATAAPVQAPQSGRSCCHRESGPAESAPATPQPQAPCPCKDNHDQPPAVLAAICAAAERGDFRSLDVSPLSVLLTA